MEEGPDKKKKSADARPESLIAKLSIVLIAPEIIVIRYRRRIEPSLSQRLGEQLHLTAYFKSGYEYSGVSLHDLITVDRGPGIEFNHLLNPLPFIKLLHHSHAGFAAHFSGCFRVFV